MESAIDLERYYMTLEASTPIMANGKVTKVIGLIIEAHGPASRLGSVCDIYPKGDMRSIKAEVLGFRDNKILLMPLEEIRGIEPGSRVVARKEKALMGVGAGLLGRVIDGLGNPIDSKGTVSIEKE